MKPTTGFLLPLALIQRAASADILFRGVSYNTDFQIQANSFNYYFFSEDAFLLNHRHAKNEAHSANSSLAVHGIQMKLNNANPNPIIQSNPLVHYYNFFQGNDATKWANGARASKEISLKNIYQGIELHTESNENGIKYEFRCKA